MAKIILSDNMSYLKCGGNNKAPKEVGGT